ncbi:LIMR family protein At5g01460 [Linum grandiflorum]
MGDFNLALVVCVIVFIFNVYLINYQHPDDRNQAYFPKVVVVFISILRPATTRTVGKRVKSALKWVIAAAIVCVILLGILYGLAGKVDFTVRHLSSTTTNFPGSWDLSMSQPCIGNNAHQIFGGVGIASLPLGLIFSFIRRPKAVITRSQYIKEATELKRAADSLHQEERSGAKGRKWRKNKRRKKEHKEEQQQSKKKRKKTMTTNVNDLSLAFLVLQHLPSLLLPSPCCGRWCNNAWPQNRVHYDSPHEVTYLNLYSVVISQALWAVLIVDLYFTVNTFLCLDNFSVIQFCATAFGYYAQATAAQEIFGHTLQSLCGIKYLYKYNVFQIAFIVLAGQTFVYYAAFGWKRRKSTGRFQLSS